mgnify:CR=1 FL=1
MKFLTIEYVPYEGTFLAWFDTEEEAVQYAKKHDGLDVYEIAREIDYFLED